MMNLISLILLNALWFASVLGAANQIIWPALMCFSLLFIVLISQKVLTKIDYKIMALSLLCGWFIDGYLSYSGLIVYQGTIVQVDLLPPLWILILWIGFGATVTKGMQWMLNHIPVGALFMLIGAPLSYYSAEKLGAVVITNHLIVLPFIAISWLVYFFLLIQITAYRKVSNDAVVQ